MTTTSSDTQVVTFSLDDGSYENLHAREVENDQFVLDNSPFYAFGVSWFDTVTVDRIGGRMFFHSVAKRGGHSTYRVRLAAPHTHDDFMRNFAKLRGFGCSFEGSKLGERLLYAIDVPPGANVAAVYKILEDMESAGDWEFEEAHFFKGNDK